MSLPVVWTILVTVGFSFIFWGAKTGSTGRSFEVSGSSLFTLGFAEPQGASRIWLTFLEAAIGLGLIALLISYLPTIYSSYSQREKGTRLLRPFAGTPPDPTQLLSSLHRSTLVAAPTLWRTASSWFIDVEQSHTSFPVLTYFALESPGQSWVATIGAVLDASAFLVSTSGMSDDETAEGPLLALAYGIPAIVGVARAAGLPLDPAHLLLDLIARESEAPPPISVQQEEYEAAIDRLESSGIVGHPDRQQGWHRYAWIRSGYDQALRGLAGLTLAVPAPGTTDRPATVGRPRLFGRRPLAVDWSPGVVRS